jgi:Family of unknown function (DUF5335)
LTRDGRARKVLRRMHARECSQESCQMEAVKKSDWAAFGERVTKGLTGKQAEIEVDSLEIGAQI